VFHLKSEGPQNARVGVAIGDSVLDLAAVAKANLFTDASVNQGHVFDQVTAT